MEKKNGSIEKLRVWRTWYVNFFKRCLSPDQWEFSTIVIMQPVSISTQSPPIENFSIISSPQAAVKDIDINTYPQTIELWPFFVCFKA